MRLCTVKLGIRAGRGKGGLVQFSVGPADSALAGERLVSAHAAVAANAATVIRRESCSATSNPSSFLSLKPQTNGDFKEKQRLDELAIGLASPPARTNVRQASRPPEHQLAGRSRKMVT